MSFNLSVKFEGLIIYVGDKPQGTQETLLRLLIAEIRNHRCVLTVETGIVYDWPIAQQLERSIPLANDNFSFNLPVNQLKVTKGFYSYIPNFTHQGTFPLEYPHGLNINPKKLNPAHPSREGLVAYTELVTGRVDSHGAIAGYEFYEVLDDDKPGRPIGKPKELAPNVGYAVKDIELENLLITSQNPEWKCPLQIWPDNGEIRLRICNIATNPNAVVNGLDLDFCDIFTQAEPKPSVIIAPMLPTSTTPMLLPKPSICAGAIFNPISLDR
jgi:hypothetical protein